MEDTILIQLNELKQLIIQIKCDIGNIKDAQIDISNRIDNLESRMNGHDHEISDLQDIPYRIDDLENKVDSHYTELEDVVGEVSHLQ